MSKAARSLFVYALYLIVVGFCFLMIPNTILGFFRFPWTPQIWIRVVGMLLLFLAVYYIQVARIDLREFMRTTVFTRVSITGFFTIFVVLGLAEPTLLLYAAVELLFALWTWYSLRRR